MSEPLFKQLDGNTLFMAANCWRTDTEILRAATGVWAWEDVSSVENISDDVLSEIRPLCAVKWQGGYLYLHAEFKDVLDAWRAYRLRYGAKHLTWTTQN